MRINPQALQDNTATAMASQPYPQAQPPGVGQMAFSQNAALSPLQTLRSQRRGELQDLRSMRDTMSQSDFLARKQNIRQQYRPLIQQVQQNPPPERTGLTPVNLNTFSLSPYNTTSAADAMRTGTGQPVANVMGTLRGLMPQATYQPTQQDALSQQAHQQLQQQFAPQISQLDAIGRQLRDLQPGTPAFQQLYSQAQQLNRELEPQFNSRLNALIAPQAQQPAPALMPINAGAGAPYGGGLASMPVGAVPAGFGASALTPAAQPLGSLAQAYDIYG